MDLVRSTINSLKRSGQDDIESFLSSIVSAVLPNKLQTLWDQQSKKDKAVPPVERLLDFIDDHAESIHANTSNAGKVTEPPAKKPVKKVDKQPETTPYKHRSNVHVSSSSVSTYRWECFLCKPEKHPLFLCPKWESMTVAQRLGHIQSRKLCHNCLAVGHKTTECKSLYKCRECGAAHHTSIHQDAPPAHINSSISWAQQLPNSLLMTAQVLITAPGGQTIQARALIDPGATLSLVSNKVTQQLQLPLSKARIAFTGVQVTPCKTSNHLTDLVLSPVQGGQPRVTVTAAVVTKVTDNLPAQELPAVRELSHLQELELADPRFHIPAKIDLLIGAEVYPRLLVAKDCVVVGPGMVPAAYRTIFS